MNAHFSYLEMYPPIVSPQIFPTSFFPFSVCQNKRAFVRLVWFSLKKTASQHRMRLIDYCTGWFWIEH